MIATYRLQLRPEFTFADAEVILPYLKQLGVSHLYLSPLTEAHPGSSHGYDVIDHNEVRAELGGREGFDQLLEAARVAELELILDFVPNHAGVGSWNLHWQEVLAYGPYAPHAEYFDIDWTPLKDRLQQKVLLPFLGQPYGDALDEGELVLRFVDERFYVAYYDNRFAVAPLTYAHILETILPAFERTDVYWDLKDIQEAYASLKPEDVQRAQILNQRLARLDAQLGLDDKLGAFEGLALHELLEAQYWRLAYWKTAGHEINYRRFFDINGLVALCVDKEAVFWDVHRLLGDLVTQDGVAGVRIDHVDGIADPQVYLQRVRELGARHLWVEKILAPGEQLPSAWPVDGTTGYGFMNDALGVMLPPGGREALARLYRRFVPEAPSFEATVYRSKKLVMNTALSSELFRLTYSLNRLSEADYHTRDFTLEALHEALREVVAAMTRYRTYLPHDVEDARPVIEEAVKRARRRNAASESSVYDFIERVILGDLRPDLLAKQRAWVTRLQQYTAPVAAKGVEDTAFYRYVPLAALNEVGGEPAHVASVDAFHGRAQHRAAHHPRELSATATHDHKRGEDTRLRILTIADDPKGWTDTVEALTAIGHTYRRAPGPSPTDEYLFYQILASQWPDHGDEAVLSDRLAAYMQKASRESKLETNWINPDEAYETSLDLFVRGIVSDTRTADTLDAFAQRVAEGGFVRMMTQLVLKYTVPGVPDIYQGTEILDLSLVDPDNRHLVDYRARQAALDTLQPLLDTPNSERLRTMAETGDEQTKLYALARLLHLRRRHTDLFLTGSYDPLTIDGAAGDQWMAFTRQTAAAALVVLVPRFPSSVRGPAEQSTVTLMLPEALHGLTWHDALLGTTHADLTRIRPADAWPWRVLHAERPSATEQE